MKDKQEFYDVLTEIDGKDYTEFSRLIGDFDFTRYTLKITRVPKSPEDHRIVVVVRIPQAVAGFPPPSYSTPIRRTALEDLLTRKMVEQSERMARFNENGVAVRRIHIPRPGQKILPRSSIVLTEDYLEARIMILFPMRRGRIQSEPCIDVFFAELPELVNESLLYCNIDASEVDAYTNLMEDADQVRQALPTRGLIGFIGEGSLIRRAGGTDEPDYTFDQPLEIDGPLISEVDVPNRGTVRGFGIMSGVTLILGDDFSGRNELMKAIAAGIYNHVPGDGREHIVSMPDLVYIAADRGRSIQHVDISAFLDVADVDSEAFTSLHADACAAQAASTVEALEVGARVLLFDEQDSYPGFLAQDSRIHRATGASSSPIIPLAARARQFADDMGISIIVAGHSAVAEFIPVADTILSIDNYRIRDITADAKALSIETALETPADDKVSKLVDRSRWVIPSSIDPGSGREDAVIEARPGQQLRFGKYELDLSHLCQLADESQVETIGLIMEYGRERYMEDSRPIREMLDLVDRDLSTEGLECLADDLRHDLARPRRYEIAAALNRLPSLRISSIEG